jgi:hypothetical protein
MLACRGEYDAFYCDVCEASNIRSGRHALTATRVTADAADRSKESAPNGGSIDPRSILDR